MKILFVDEKDWVKKVPYTIHYFAERLVKRGHQVYAVDYDDTWQRTGWGDWLAARRRRMVAKLDPACAVDVTSPAFVKLPGLSRLSTLATHSWEIGRLLRRARIDCIVTYSLTNALPTMALARALGVPLAFHSIDMLGPLVPHRALERPALLLEAQLIRRSDCVLALTPIFAERAHLLGARQTAVIPNGVNTDLLRPGLDTSGLRAELGLGAEKVIVFVGTLTRHVGLDVFLRHFAALPWAHVRLVVVGDDVVGGGRELERIRGLCRELGIERNVIFTGLQPAQRVPLYMNLADVCISPFPPSTFSRYNIAMKVFEYMACGRPTVMFRLAGTQSLVPSESGVCYVDSYEEMCAAIGQLLSDDEQRARLGAAGRLLVEQHFTWDKVAADLESVLLRLCERRARHGRPVTGSAR